MKGIRCALLALCLLCGTAVHAQDAGGQTPAGDLLLIYDEPDQVALVENMLTAFDRTVDKIKLDEYEIAYLNRYRHIVTLTPIPLGEIPSEKKILCIGDGFTLPGVTAEMQHGAGLEIATDHFYQYLNHIDEFSVITSFTGRGFGTMQMSFDREYPFGVRVGNVYYAPYLSAENISTFAFGEMLPDFFDDNYQGGIYFIVEDMFAFSDLDMLCKTADELYLANIPFIVKVMPLYTNTETDAFLRYTQVLRYVEARGGAIVMTPPIVNGKAEEEEIRQMTDIAVSALTAEGVAVLPSVEGFYFVDMEYLKEVKSPAKRYETFAFDVGILENLPSDDVQLKQMIANLNGRWYEFGSYREKFGLQSKPFLEVPVDEVIAARQEEIETPLFFSVGNDVLTIAVSVLLVFIFALISFSRVKYKRKFTKKAG